jgi:hypothetical protein
MFIGHFAVGLAAKPFAPKVSVGTLVLAGCLPDLVWLPFLLAGMERVAIKPGITAANHLDLVEIAFSHSLLMDFVWAALLAAGYYAWRRDRRAAWILFALVLSHWLLDFISHRPDMPLAPGLEGRYRDATARPRRHLRFLGDDRTADGDVVPEPRRAPASQPARGVRRERGDLLDRHRLGLLGGSPPSICAICVVCG